MELKKKSRRQTAGARRTVRSRAKDMECGCFLASSAQRSEAPELYTQSKVVWGF